MPAPVFSLPLSGSDPKLTSKQLLETAVNAVILALYSEIATVATGLNPRGSWDASGGSFPSGASAGDYYIASAAGTVDGATFAVGDWLVALVDAPSVSVFAANWFRADYSTVLPSIIQFDGSKLTLGNAAAGPGVVNVVNSIDAVAADGVTYAGEYNKTVWNLDGADAYQLLAAHYIATPVINNPDGATWQDACALFIQGQPKDPLDQSGSTSFGMFVNAGYNRIRDRLTVGNFDFSNDVLTANGATGTDWTLTVRNEGVAQPNMFRVIEPTKSGTTDQADPGFPMLRMQRFDGQGTYFDVRTGGDIVMTQMGEGAWQDANKSRVTSYILGVDSNGFLTETQKAKIGVGNIGVALSSGATIAPRGPVETILLNGTGNPSTYTLPNGFDGQELILKASQTSATLVHTVTGSFQFDPDQFPTSNTASISLLNFESVHLIFRGSGTNRWVVVGRTKR